MDLPVQNAFNFILKKWSRTLCLVILSILSCLPSIAYSEEPEDINHQNINPYEMGGGRQLNFSVSYQHSLYDEFYRVHNTSSGDRYYLEGAGRELSVSLNVEVLKSLNRYFSIGGGAFLGGTGIYAFIAAQQQHPIGDLFTFYLNYHIGTGVTLSINSATFVEVLPAFLFKIDYNWGILASFGLNSTFEYKNLKSVHYMGYYYPDNSNVHKWQTFIGLKTILGFSFMFE